MAVVRRATAQACARSPGPWRMWRDTASPTITPFGLLGEPGITAHLRAKNLDGATVLALVSWTAADVADAEPRLANIRQRQSELRPAITPRPEIVRRSLSDRVSQRVPGRCPAGDVKYRNRLRGWGGQCGSGDVVTSELDGLADCVHRLSADGDFRP